MVPTDERTAAPTQQPPQQQPPAEQPAQQQQQQQQQPAGQAPKEPKPDGAFAVFRTSDGTADAWLRTDEGDDPVGYVRENSEDPPRTVRYTNPAHWAEDVDGRGMAQVEGGGDQPGAAPVEGQEPDVSEVSTALQDLADGKRNLDDVAKFFREREWPRRPEPGSDEAQAPGSFSEVADAYSAKLITHDQYVALAQAATDAMREQSGMGDQSDQQQPDQQEQQQ